MIEFIFLGVNFPRGRNFLVMIELIFLFLIFPHGRNFYSNDIIYIFGEFIFSAVENFSAMMFFIFLGAQL